MRVENREFQNMLLLVKGSGDMAWNHWCSCYNTNMKIQPDKKHSHLIHTQ